MRRAVAWCFAFLFSVAAVAAPAPCEPPATMPGTGLAVKPGFVEFLDPAVLEPLRNALPVVAVASVDAALHAADTMWYDENSMVFSYQDSVEVVVGHRANCVARKVGERATEPGIRKLLTLFGPDHRFLFPFRKAAGTDEVTNVKVLNFWVPPKVAGKAMPVRYWRESARGRFFWVFPVGTLFGEVLYQQAPDGKWTVFEIRTRRRYREGWEVDLFRPFRTADALAQAIDAERPVAQQSAQLKAFVAALRNPATLVPHRMESTAYAKAFTAVDGALDVLPAPGDEALIAQLLRETPFVSMEGAVWKKNGALETYAPGSAAEFSIVPRDYRMGMIPVNEVSCNRCHSETGRRLGDFEFDAILYGEVWGEDRIFTWHPFEPNQYIYDTWDESDSPTRTLNPRLVNAGLLRQGQPSDTDPDYHALPMAYVPDRALRRGARR